MLTLLSSWKSRVVHVLHGRWDYKARSARNYLWKQIFSLYISTCKGILGAKSEGFLEIGCGNGSFQNTGLSLLYWQIKAKVCKCDDVMQCTAKLMLCKRLFPLLQHFHVGVQKRFKYAMHGHLCFWKQREEFIIFTSFQILVDRAKFSNVKFFVLK